MCPVSKRRLRYDNCAFGTFYTLTIQALCGILRLICKRYLTGLPLNVATTVKYLGSSIANDCSLDKDLSARIQSAYATFGRLRERLWNKHNIKLEIKGKVYRAIIMSCFMYSSEIYTMYRSHIQRLSEIPLRHLRAILGIKWSDRVPNNEILQRADMPSIETMIPSGQRTWTGHVVRMNDDRQPKAVLYGELWQAKRNVGKPHLRYMDCSKQRRNVCQRQRAKNQQATAADDTLQKLVITFCESVCLFPDISVSFAYMGLTFCRRARRPMLVVRTLKHIRNSHQRDTNVDI